MTRRMSAILGEYSPAGQGCTRHFSVPPLEYKNSTSYKKYRPDFGLNIQESYGKRPIPSPGSQYSSNISWMRVRTFKRCAERSTNCADASMQRFEKGMNRLNLVGQVLSWSA